MPAPHNYYTGGELPSNYTTDQAMYYPITYYTTGYETPTVYTDPYGQTPTPHYSAETGQYLYYVQGYGYIYSTPDQFGPYQYQPYQSPVPPAPTGYVQFYVQPESQPLTPPEPPAVSTGTRPSTGTYNSRAVNNINNTGTKNRSNASTSANVSLSPVSLVTGASRSSHHSQITNKPSEHSSRDLQGENANSAIQSALTEQNRGPRTGKSNGATSKSKSNSPDISVASNAIKIYAELYKGVDFSVDRQSAKCFVIKSYSEDDVHKSIKYNVWSSTPNGNRRLNAAYLAAQESATGNPDGCPVLLFFSVNASGQFCGVAEMVGPVDFGKHVDVWQQDKWQGSFPVKWHIIKDVLNASFRHITLENNENKPVTNSRDTQEIPFKAAISMLKIFKNSPYTSSVLEDFPFYESRQLSMLQDKCRRMGKVYDSSLFTPAVVVKTRSTVDQIESQSSNKEINGDQSEPEVESEEKLELEEEKELGDELKEKLELGAESKEKRELEAESKEKTELEAELKDETELELNDEKESQLELKEEAELKDESEAQVELKDETEAQVELKEKKELEPESSDWVKVGSVPIAN